MFFNQGDATIKIETQEQELRGLRTRVQELEILLVEQQDTLDRLIADAMGEVESLLRICYICVVVS